MMEMLQATGDDAEQFPEVPDFANGLVLRNTFLPEEVLVNVLSFVNWRDMPRCRSVCKTWKRLVDAFVMLKKLKREAKKTLNASFTNPSHKIPPESIPFHLYFAISQNAFGRNLIKNEIRSGGVPVYNQLIGCDKVFDPRYINWDDTVGSECWVDPVNGCVIGNFHPLSGFVPSESYFGAGPCYAPRYGRCHEEKFIVLAENGLTAKIMDEVRPHIEVSERYAPQADCGLFWKIGFKLLDENEQVIDEFIDKGIEPVGSIEWQQVSHTFKDYGPGVRDIVFDYEARNIPFWGIGESVKMAGGSVVARIPSPS